MELNATPFTLTLFAQAVFLAISRLDFVSLDVQRGITIALIVVNAALVMLFRTDSGKQTLNHRLINQSKAMMDERTMMWKAGDQSTPDQPVG